MMVAKPDAKDQTDADEQALNARLSKAQTQKETFGTVDEGAEALKGLKKRRGDIQLIEPGLSPKARKRSPLYDNPRSPE
jgi:hypothetical protein